jgi:alkylated DNA repair dioxygenase AlkB
MQLGAMPDFLNELIDRLLARHVLSQRPDQVIINEYLPGQVHSSLRLLLVVRNDGAQQQLAIRILTRTTTARTRSQGISAHVDKPSLFDNEIVSISLGSPCVMEFKHKATKTTHSVLLARRSLVLMKVRGVCQAL